MIQRSFSHVRCRRSTIGLLLMFTTLIPAFLFIGFTAAVEVAKAKPLISGYNLNVAWGAQSGDPTDLKIEIGNRWVKSFSVHEPSTAGNYTLMWATVVFGFQSNFYTTYKTTDAYMTTTPITETIQYLGLQTCTSPTLTSTWQPTQYFYVQVPGYNLGDKSVKARGFEGNLKPAIALKSITPAQLDFGTVQFEIKTKEFIGVPARVSVINGNWTEIGVHSNYYKTDMTAVQVVNRISKDPVAASAYSTEGNSEGIAQTQDDLEIQEQKLGSVEVLDTWENLNTPGYGQTGAHEQATNGNDYVLENGINIINQPNVALDLEKYRVWGRNHVLVDNYKHWYDVRVGVIDEDSDPLSYTDRQRVLGWAVQNYVLSNEFEVEMEVYSTCEIAYDTSERTRLDQPDLGIADTYWNTVFLGTGGQVDIDATTASEDWWSQYGIYVLIGVVLVVGFIGVNYYMTYILAYKAGKGDAGAAATLAEFKARKTKPKKE